MFEKRTQKRKFFKTLKNVNRQKGQWNKEMQRDFTLQLKKEGELRWLRYWAWLLSPFTAWYSLEVWVCSLMNVTTNMIWWWCNCSLPKNSFFSVLQECWEKSSDLLLTLFQLSGLVYCFIYSCKGFFSW